MASLLKSIETVPVDSLIQHPGNARRGDVAAIAESLDENFQFTPIVVQRSTRHILSGNHTVQAAQRLGWTEIDVTFVDVSDDRALRILLAANRTADRATTDDESLAELLGLLQENFAGTGYTQDDLDNIQALLGEDENPPDLDKLADDMGDPVDSDLWPTLRFKVPPQVRDDFYDLTNNCANPNDDNNRFMHLVQKVRAAA